MIPFITSRTSTRRLLPPRLAGGIKGSTCAHSSSVRSLGYRNLLRSQRPRFFAVHIGGAPLESGHHFESQAIQRIQNVFGRTLKNVKVGRSAKKLIRASIKPPGAGRLTTCSTMLSPSGVQVSTRKLGRWRLRGLGLFLMTAHR